MVTRDNEGAVGVYYGVYLCCVTKVDQQTVFRTTTVRAALRKDGSWIRPSDEELKDPQP